MDIKAEYEALTQKMKKSLPIKAFPTRELVSKLRDKNPGLTLKSEFLIKDVMNTGDDFSRCIIVAQLNYLFPTNANKIQWCAKDAKGANQLPKMATGNYQPNGIGAAWDKAKIVKYLRNNYMSV